jgi:hypothetical protein
MEEVNIVRKISTGASKLRIIGLVLVLVAFSLFIYFTRKQEKSIETQANVIANNETIINQKNAELKTVTVTQTRHDQLESIVNEYFQLRAKHDVDGLDNLYADHLDSYFKNLKNCSKEQVRQADRLYWQNFPKETFAPKGEPQITINQDGTAKATVNGRNCREANSCVDELVQITFDSGNKITSVKGFVARS